MNILLVYPKFPETFWSFSYALSFIGRKAAFPPLGLLTIASLLPEEWNKRLVDLNVEELKNGDLLWADLVFLSSMAVQRKSVVQIIERCQALQITVAAGGPLFTSEPEKFPEVDHLILNEAELTLPLFLADIQKGKPEKIYHVDGFCDLASTPPPQWDLIDVKHYASMNIQFSRGCPFNCEFCNVTTFFGRHPRLKTTGQIITELNRIYATGWRNGIFFVDDNFIGNKEFLKNSLLPAIIEWRRDKKGCVFFTESSINLADDPKLLDMMVKAGFDSVFIGIESPDEMSLAECHKHQNRNRDLLESVKRIHRSGLQVMGGFIVGFDSDLPSIFQKQVDFIQKSGIAIAMVGMLQAPPGTRLFERLSGENRIASFFSGDNVDGTTNIIPRMGLDTLLNGYQSIMKDIYSPANYYRRVRTLLRELKTPVATMPLNLQRCLSFFRAAMRLGLLGKERFHYWQLMFWTLFRRPGQLALAVTLSIYGHHYRRICELYIYKEQENTLHDQNRSVTIQK
ncbi:B12-binding domain-containing radical SAM protein [Desulfogranum japonicum]|uniref:B12-binding domain-containing radical SAM protein n=1 Tax=Desulfogranum japonicum TaxID=231447 RepID=UPI00041D7471|nr:B12-binding domain-containing radical SAM protein [Desulfogranum japonicum]